MSEAEVELDSSAMYRKAFDEVDVDKDGLLSALDIQRHASAQGKTFDIPVLQNLIDLADLNENGMIDFPEFIAIITQAAARDDPVLEHALSDYDISKEKLRECWITKMDKMTEVERSELKSTLQQYNISEIRAYLHRKRDEETDSEDYSDETDSCSELDDKTGCELDDFIAREQSIESGSEQDGQIGSERDDETDDEQGERKIKDE